MKSLSYILKTKHETKCDSVFGRAQLTTSIFFFLELETRPLPVPEESLMNLRILCNLPLQKSTFFSGLQGHPKDWEKDHGDDQQCTGECGWIFSARVSYWDVMVLVIASGSRTMTRQKADSESDFFCTILLQICQSWFWEFLLRFSKSICCATHSPLLHTEGKLQSCVLSFSRMNKLVTMMRI